MSIQPVVEAGDVLLPEGAAWVDDFVHELSVFPNGAYDDQVDALSMGIAYLRDRSGMARWKL